MQIEQIDYYLADNIFYSDKIFSSNLKGHDKRSIKGLKEYIKIVTSVEKGFSTSFFDIGDGLAVSMYRGAPDG